MDRAIRTVITVRKALETRFAGKAKVLYSLGADFFDEKWPDTEIIWDPPTEKEQQAHRRSSGKCAASRCRHRCGRRPI